MIKEQTVLVLGAGASRDLGFPTGERLWQDIYSFILNQSRGYVNNQSSLREDNSKLLARLLELAVEFENVKTKIFGTAVNMSDSETEIQRRRVYQSICTGKALETCVALENNWVNMDRKDSLIKDFFRKVPQADLV